MHPRVRACKGGNNEHEAGINLHLVVCPWGPSVEVRLPSSLLECRTVVVVISTMMWNYMYTGSGSVSFYLSDEWRESDHLKLMSIQVVENQKFVIQGDLHPSFRKFYCQLDWSDKPDSRITNLVNETEKSVQKTLFYGFSACRNLRNVPSRRFWRKMGVRVRSQKSKLTIYVDVVW